MSLAPFAARGWPVGFGQNRRQNNYDYESRKKVVGIGWQQRVSLTLIAGNLAYMYNYNIIYCPVVVVVIELLMFPQINKHYLFFIHADTFASIARFFK